jgi:hypothetical protein
MSVLARWASMMQLVWLGLSLGEPPEFNGLGAR